MNLYNEEYPARRLEELNDEIEKKNARLRQLNAELEEKQTYLYELDNSIGMKEQVRDDINKATADFLLGMQEQANVKLAEVEGLKAQKQLLHEEILGKINELNDVQREFGLNNEKYLESEERKLYLERQVTELEDKITRLGSEITTLEAQKNEVAELQLLLNDLKERFNDLKKDYNLFLADLQSDVDENLKLIQSQKQEIDGLKEISAAMKKEMEGNYQKAEEFLSQKSILMDEIDNQRKKFLEGISVEKKLQENIEKLEMEKSQIEEWLDKVSDEDRLLVTNLKASEIEAKVAENIMALENSERQLLELGNDLQILRDEKIRIERENAEILAKHKEMLIEKDKIEKDILNLIDNRKILKKINEPKEGS